MTEHHDGQFGHSYADQSVSASARNFGLLARNTGARIGRLTRRCNGRAAICFFRCPSYRRAPLSDDVNRTEVAMKNTEKIARLEAFKDLLISWAQPDSPAALRSQINQEKTWVRQEVIEAGCFKTMTISPPPAVVGLVIQQLDPFDMMFDPPWEVDLLTIVVDMVDATIGVLRAPADTSGKRDSLPTVRTEIVENYAFVAMPMDASDASLVDVLDAIKEASRRCGVQAERVDDPQTNERITDRVLESIRRAEFVIADLTSSKPNVYYEAGYAHALGKTPIYIARAETKLEFDVKDYPVIFFANLKDMKDALETRLRALAATRAG